MRLYVLVQSALDLPDDRMMSAITRDAVLLFAQSAAVFLLPVLIVAIVVGLIQTILSVSEQSLSFLPKLLTLVAVLAIAGERVMNGLASFLESGLLDMVSAIH